MDFLQTSKNFSRELEYYMDDGDIVEVDTAQECSSLYTFVLGYDGDSDDEECIDLTSTESGMWDESTGSSSHSLFSGIPLFPRTVTPSVPCSIASEHTQSEGQLIINEPIVSTNSSAITVTTTSTSQRFSLTSTAASVEQNLPAGIQTSPLDLTVTTSRANHTIDTSTTSRGPVHTFPPTSSVVNMCLNKNTEGYNIHKSSDKRNQDSDNALLSDCFKPVNFRLIDTPTTSSLIDPRNAITSLHFLNDVMLSDKSQVKNNIPPRNDVTSCSEVIPEYRPITSLKKSPEPQSVFLSQTESSRKDTSSPSFCNKTVTSHISSSTTSHPTSSLCSERSYGQQQDHGPQEELTIKTSWNESDLCGYRNTQSRESESKISKAMTVTRTVFSTGQTLCSSTLEQPPTIQESGIKSKDIVREKESTETLEQSKDTESSDKDERPDQSCPLIPTVDGDIVDFSTAIWPCQDKDYQYLCYGVDGRLDLRIPPGRSVMKYSKPVTISSCKSMSSPLYRPCPQGNPNDPRTKKPSARIRGQPNDSNSNRSAKTKRSKNPSPQVEQGLFSRILSFSEHSSSGEAKSGNSSDETFSVDKDYQRKPPISTIEEALETKTKAKSPPNVSMFENVASLCNEHVDTQTIPFARSDSQLNCDTSSKDEECKLQEFETSAATKIVEKSKKSKERHSKSKERIQKNSHATTTSTTSSTASECINNNKTSKITPLKRPEKILLHSDNKRKCLGLQKHALPRSLNPNGEKNITGNKKKTERKQSDEKVNCGKVERTHESRETESKAESRNTKPKLSFYINSQGKRVYEMNCKPDKRNVLDYHLCSLCMLDETVIYLKPPALRKKSTNCLKCTKKLSPKDLMCKSCKQCFPNMVTYAGHVYNLASFHPSHKATKDYICSRCRQTFKSRFLFHTHLAQSKCTRVCLSCEKIFPTRQALGEHTCEGNKIVYVKDFI